MLRVMMVLALATAAGAGVLDEMDRAELGQIENLMKLGRALEAREMLRDRDLALLAGQVGARYHAAATLLRVARAVGDQNVAATCLKTLHEDGIALAERAADAGDADRAGLLRTAVRVLSLLPEPDAEALFRRGWCQYHLSEMAAARADLSAALALAPDNRTARATLARTEWRLGDRRGAIVTVVDGLKRDPSRGEAELLADMLRAAKRRGKADRAEALAARWAQALPADETASPLRALIGEMQLERDDLAGALDTFGRVVAQDRPWLLGGIVRTARAQAARGVTERNAVETALARLPLEAGRMPAPLLKLSGDFAMNEDRGRALRHYAAAVTGGEAEALELVEHARGQTPGAPIAPGAVAALLTGHATAFDAQFASDEFNDLPPVSEPLWLGGPFSSEGHDLGQATVRAWGSPATVRARNAVAIVRGTGRALDAAVNVAAIQGTQNDTRRSLIVSYLKGDVEGTKSQLDACSLVSWQVIRSGVTGALRALPPGAAANVEPVSQPASTPAALETVGQALAALSDPKATEEVRLARLMEVADQRTPFTQRPSDPVAIDLDGNGQIDLTRNDSHQGAARFDLDGWGQRREVQWLAANRDGWLCEDKNHDGRIASGHELFGTAGGFTDGFEKLALRDANADGVVSGDELAGLSIWRESTNPGKVDAGELIPLAAAGVTSIAVPKVGLRAVAVVHGTQRLAAEIWPDAIQERLAGGPVVTEDLDLNGI